MTKALKILLINDYATPTGGAELWIFNHRNKLRKKGHDARLFSSSARPLGLESQADYECFGTNSRFRTLLQSVNPFAVWKLRKVLAEFQPDVVHLNLFLTQLSPLILPLLKNIPTLYHVHWYRPVCPLGTKFLPGRGMCTVSPGIACYQNRCLPLRDWIPLMVQMKLWWHWRYVCDAILANSKAVQQALLAEGIEPVEIAHYSVIDRPQRPPLSLPPIVAFAGRLVWEKGADALVRAFAQARSFLPDARLLIAGDGPERQHLEKLIQEFNLASNISLLGHLTPGEMEQAFASAWVQVVPSRWAEPFGLVALEAMWRGTAVIASQCGGLPEIVSDGKTGFLIPPNDSEALATALLNVLQDKNLAENLGKNGRQHALFNFNDNAETEPFIELYQRLLSNRLK